MLQLAARSLRRLERTAARLTDPSTGPAPDALPFRAVSRTVVPLLHAFTAETDESGRATRPGSTFESCTVVLPTYNERATVQDAIRDIDAALRGTGREYEILVVDDDSPDGTLDAVEAVADEAPVRAIRRRGRRGLATAVLAGVERARYDVVAVMDADLQHPPERLPALVAAVEDGADVAVGSRYVPGGSADGLPPTRRVISRGAAALARTIVPHPVIEELSDPMSGFFACDRRLLDGREFDPLGYKILLEVVVRGDPDDVAEIGYRFRERANGETGFRVTTILNYLRHLLRLRRAAERDDA